MVYMPTASPHTIHGSLQQFISTTLVTSEIYSLFMFCSEESLTECQLDSICNWPYTNLSPAILLFYNTNDV